AAASGSRGRTRSRLPRSNGMSTDFEPGRPYSGWVRSLVPLATFDSEPELVAAIALDSSNDLEWWLRNDPPRFALPTPIGGFEPAFIYGRQRGGRPVHGILEIKGDYLWHGPESSEGIKATAACDWVRHQNAIVGHTIWEFATVLASDVGSAPHIDALRNY